MKLSTSQQALADLALAPLQGFQTRVVLAENLSGVTRVCEHLTRAGPAPAAPTARTAGRPVRAVRALGLSPYEAACTLAQEAGLPAANWLGFADAFARILGALARRREAGPLSPPAGIAILIEESHLMSPRDLERLVVALEWAADHAAIPTRALLLCGRVGRWNHHECRFQLAWPYVPQRLLDRVGQNGLLKFTRAGLDEIRRAEQPDELTSTAVLASA